VNGGPTSVRSV